MVTQHLESSRLIDRMPLHQNPFRPLGERAVAESPFEIVVFGEAA